MSKLDNHILNVSHIYKSFVVEKKSISVLENISLQVHQGEFIAILGASGSGKTTLLRIISGLEDFDEGELWINGSQVSGVGGERTMVFQEPRLLPWKTIEENVSLGLELLGKKKAKAIEGARHYLSVVGLSEFNQAYPSQLSGGMAQRVGIARALAVSPEILLMDEPLGALDAMKRISMQNELERIWKEQNVTIVMVTHDIEEAVFLADRVITLDSFGGLKNLVIDLPRPRDRSSKEFICYREELMQEFSLH